jgi:hypothetical protein
MDGALLERWRQEWRMEILLLEQGVLREEVDGIVFSDLNEKFGMTVSLDKHFRKA